MGHLMLARATVAIGRTLPEKSLEKTAHYRTSVKRCTAWR